MRSHAHARARARARAHTHTVLKIKLRALDSIQLLSYELRSYHQRFLSLSPIKWHKPVVSVTQKAEAGGSHATVCLGYRVSSRFTLCAPFSKLKVKGGLEIQCGGGTLELCSQSPGFSTIHPRICYLCVLCISKPIVKNLTLNRTCQVFLWHIRAVWLGDCLSLRKE